MTRDTASTSQLATFLRTHRDAILADWHRAVVDRPESRGLSREALIDHLPQLLDAIAEAGAARTGDPRARLDTLTAERHAVERLGEGLDLSQVVVELAVLRDCILQAWLEERGTLAEPHEVRFLNRAVDRAIAASVDRYVGARDRTMTALDRISTASFESRRLDDLLLRLLQVMVSTTESIDTGVILLREGDELVVRAAVGVEEDAHNGFRVRIGEGFSGQVAAEGRPATLTEEQMDRLRSPVLRSRGLRSLYGIPLIDRDMVGVAHVGSRTAPEISDQDKRLLQALGARATSAIVQHLLHRDAERRAAELTAVLASMPDPVFIGSWDGVRQANAGALAVLGFGSAEELNRSFRDLHEILRVRRAETGAPMPPGEWPFARALHGETSTADVIVYSPRLGRDVVLRCAAAPIRKGGEEVEEAVCVCIDVTDSRRRGEELLQAVQQAEQAVRDRQHVLGVVSHDLRNPLNTILLGADTLRLAAPELPPVATKTIDGIQRAGHRMNRLIGDLLDVSSIQAGRLAVKPSPVSASAAVEEAVASARPVAEAKGLRVAFELPEGAPLLVRADRDRLIQALSNLVSNAVKVTEQGSVTVGAAREADAVVFTVRDTGPGLAEEARARMFEPYWRSPTASYRGTGLGLSITRGIVEAHGGRLWVESEPGRGATFHFTLPAVSPDA